MTIVPLERDEYQARCDDCSWSFVAGSEPFAEQMAEAHDNFARHDETKAALARYAALPPAVSIEDRHVHGPACTDATCPGLGFPTRAELIAGRHK